MKKLIRLRGSIRKTAWEAVLVISRISLSRLIEGGAAMLAHTKRNHHNEIIGIDVSNPLVRATLRVCVSSYVILAMQNRPDETKPWAIIIANAPYIPICVLDMTPAISRPIWPTDE